MHTVSGFTLIEMLIVLLIVGVIITLAGLSIGENRQEQIRREAERLHALLQLAAEESVIAARPLGLAVDADGYRFLVDTGEEWEPLENDRTLHPRDMPSFVRLELTLEDLPDGVEPPGEDESRPAVVLYPSTELTPFEITVRGDEPGPQWLIGGSLGGEITIGREDP